MHVLIKHAPSIAGLAPLVEETSAFPLMPDVEFQLGSYGRIRPDWFTKHLGHDLVPIDEYGRCADICAEYAACGSCGHRKRCELKLGHDGPHVAKERA